MQLTDSGINETALDQSDNVILKLNKYEDDIAPGNHDQLITNPNPTLAT